jgi:3-oxoacyl-[acyl-carrier protein] reductase
VNTLAHALGGEGIHIAYLVNNAGINGAGEVWALESRLWERVLRVNLYGTFYLTRAFSRAMIERRFGRIVNLASVYAYHPGTGEAPYAAAKAGIAGYTRSTALDLAPYGITVNVIAPGLIWHEGLKGVVSEEMAASMVRRVPVGRAGKPEEIAATVAFLCSADAAYITGQTIHVNGGWYLPG